MTLKARSRLATVMTLSRVPRSCSNALPLWRCVTLRDMRLPCGCHAVAMRLPCGCHAVTMRLPCCCHAVAMLLPCGCHAVAMRLLPCYCHAAPNPARSCLLLILSPHSQRPRIHNAPAFTTPPHSQRPRIHSVPTFTAPPHSQRRACGHQTLRSS
jgi:hypothetical protein